MCRLLEKENIPCKVIYDSAVGYKMEEVDMVMVGAEGVVESGGIINRVGDNDEMLKEYSLIRSFTQIKLQHTSLNRVTAINIRKSDKTERRHFTE